jgi:hypothetical protein
MAISTIVQRGVVQLPCLLLSLLSTFSRTHSNIVHGVRLLIEQNQLCSILQLRHLVFCQQHRQRGADHPMKDLHQRHQRFIVDMLGYPSDGIRNQTGKACKITASVSLNNVDAFHLLVVLYTVRSTHYRPHVSHEHRSSTPFFRRHNIAARLTKHVRDTSFVQFVRKDLMPLGMPYEKKGRSSIRYSEEAKGVLSSVSVPRYLSLTYLNKILTGSCRSYASPRLVKSVISREMKWCTRDGWIISVCVVKYHSQRNVLLERGWINSRHHSLNKFFSLNKKNEWKGHRKWRNRKAKHHRFVAIINWYSQISSLSLLFISLFCS